MQSENKLKVAVYMITYNHEPFIAKAIESVLVQETDFDYHLFIGEDGSKDKTAEICRKYATQFPHKITLFSDGVNRGAVKNAERVFKACFDSKADYVAILEGDDYWTDSNKLQLQADFLDANKEFVIHGGNAFLVDEENKETQSLIGECSKSPKAFSLIDFAEKSRVVTLTAMFRNIEIKVDKTYIQVPFPDYFIWAFLLKKEHSKFFCENKVLGAYRTHSGGMYSAINSAKTITGTIKTLELINNMVGEKSFSDIANITLSRHTFRLFKIYLANKFYKKAFITAIKGAKYKKGRFGIKDYLVVLKDYFLFKKFELKGEY